MSTNIWVFSFPKTCNGLNKKYLLYANITSKDNQRLGALYRQSHKMTRLQLEIIYLSMIRPILEYGLFLKLFFSDANLIESVQRRAAVLSTGAIGRTETVRLFAETGWDSPEHKRYSRQNSDNFKE
jgi:hypothetical protein